MSKQSISPGPPEWQDPTTVRHLYRWCLKLLPKYNAVQVDGCMFSQDEMPEDPEVRVFWHTSFVTKRIDARRIMVSSGKVYSLVGSMDEYTAHTFRGLPPKLVNLFRHGFPRDWKKLLNDVFTSDSIINPEIVKTPPGGWCTPQPTKIIDMESQGSCSSAYDTRTQRDRHDPGPTHLFRDEQPLSSILNSKEVETNIVDQSTADVSQSTIKVAPISDEFKQPSPVVRATKKCTPTTSETMKNSAKSNTPETIDKADLTNQYRPPGLVLHLSGGKDTLKRKRHLRNILEEANKMYDGDDNFDSPAVKTRKLTIPAVNFAGVIEMATPCRTVSGESPQPNTGYTIVRVSPTKTPHSNLTPVRSPVNRNEIDRYIKKCGMRARCFVQNRKRGKEMKVQGAELIAAPVKCLVKEAMKQHSNTPVGVHETSMASSENDDDYWSDAE